MTIGIRANMTTQEETIVMRTVIGFVTILLTILLTRLWLGYLKPWIQCVTKEKMLAKQGIPVVPGRTFVEGHGHLVRKLTEESEMKPPNPEEPHDIARNILPFHHFYSSICGKTFVYWKGREIILHTQDPNIVKEVFVTQQKKFQKNKVLNRELEVLMGKAGIVTAEGTDWIHRRKLISPAFRAEKLKEMVKPMMISINSVIERWERSVEEGDGTAEMEVEADIGLITSDVICRTSFGTTYQKGKHYFALMLEVMADSKQRSLTGSIFRWSMLPTAENRRIWKLTKEMKALVEDIVLQTRRSAASNEGSYGDDLLGLMLEASEGEEPKYRLTSAQLIDEVKTFFFGGQETTSILLMWTLMLLATHLDWQEKAFQEVQSCCGGKPLDFDSVGKLRIVNNILNETLRLYPPAIRLQRESQKDLQLGELFVPEGVTILFNIVAMHHDPDLWGSDVNTFNPDRFADGSAQAANHPQAFLPFSVGPRYCVGQGFTWLEAKLVLATILQKFKFRISPNYVHHPFDNFGPKPKTGIPILFSKR